MRYQHRASTEPELSHRDAGIATLLIIAFVAALAFLAVAISSDLLNQLMRCLICRA